MSGLEELRAKIQDQIAALNRPDLEVLESFLDAITAEIGFERITRSSWLTEEWFDAFTARLRAHHALSIDPLSTKQFEDAFNSSCSRQEWQTSPAQSATHRFFDTTVRGPDGVDRRVSLKATSARDMRPDSIHISKLTEAAWIQDERTQTGRRNRLVELFREYREATTCIVILRAFVGQGGSVLYELVEISTDLFKSLERLTVAQARLATIPIPPDQDPADFKIRVDRSDSKITLTNIRLAVCTVHARWILPPPTHS